MNKHSIAATLSKRTILGVILTSALAISAGIFLFCRQSGGGYGHLRICVLDAYTLAPIESATVVLPESGLSASTDQSGFCLIYNVPVAQPELLKRTPELRFGETSIFVYAQGYLPCALLHARVYPNRVRSGPSVYIFPVDKETGVTATTLVESPDEGLMSRLLQEYAP